MKKKEPQPSTMNFNPDVELIMVKGDKVFSEIMEYNEALKIIQNKHPVRKKKKGWIYKIYQIGFSQFQNKKSL